MKTIRIKHRGLTAAEVMNYAAVDAVVTLPEPAQTQDLTMADNVNLPMAWSCIRDLPPGYAWVGEVIDGELVETPEPTFT